MVDLVTELRFVENAPSLVPATAYDVSQLERIGRRHQGLPLATTLTYQRSVKHNRWYRGFVGIVADGVGIHPDTLHADLKFKAGMVERILLGQGGRPFIELQSTAFTRMDEAKFTEYVNLAIEIVFSQYLDGVRRKDVFARVEEMVGPRPQ